MLHVFKSEDEVNKMLKKHGYNAATAKVKAWWWQRMAFAWIMAIEGGEGQTDPQRFAKKGGILADKVGLGKTLSVIQA